MKKLFVLLLASFCWPIAVHGLDFASIDSIMEDNSFQNESNRYNSVLIYFFPEATTRLGMTLGNTQLNTRTPERMSAALNALRPVLQAAQDIDASRLSEGKEADYHLFVRNLTGMEQQLQTADWLHNPLYYASAFDAIYDLTLRTGDNSRQRLNDIRARLKQLPQTADQAARYLKNPPPFLAQLAMEKAYYAFLSFDDIQIALEETAVDTFAKQDLEVELRNDKKAIRSIFELFKQLSQRDIQTDYRMGEGSYKNYLHDVYHIDMDVNKLGNLLASYWQTAQHNLFDALAPFAQEADEVMLLDENGEMMIIPPLEDENSAAEPSAKKATKKNKKKKPEYIPPTAAQYLSLAQHFDAPQPQDDILALLTTESYDVAEQVADLVPPMLQPVSLVSMPPYYAYTEPYLFITAEGIDSFFLREPSGNNLARQATLQRDFNAPMRKVFISRQLVPGRLYQYRQTANLSKERRLYASPTMQNGWSAFAQRLAQKGNVFTADEDALAAAFAEYEQAAKAWVDYKLNTRQFTYAEALQFLVEENGFPQDEAEIILRNAILHPAQEVSTIYGLDTLEKVYKKYAKKISKRFSHKDLITLMLKAGNVMPSQFQGEVERLYRAGNFQR